MNLRKTLIAALSSAIISCAGNPGSSSKNQYPTGIPIQNKSGFVISPYTNKVIDVKGIPGGTLVQDPTYTHPENPSGSYFRVPSSKFRDKNEESAYIASLQQSNGTSISNNNSRIASVQAPKEKSAFASALGSVLEGAVGAVGVVAQTQLNSGSSSSGSSYSANTAATQQGDSQAQSNTYTGMLGLTELGAASGPVSVVFNASKVGTPGNGIVHSEVAKKYSWVIARGYVSGYGPSINGSAGGYHTDKFEVMFPKNGPYTRSVPIITGSANFSRGLKVVQITSVSYVK